MNLIDYEYHGPGWDFSRLQFQKINLIVGDSGAGKTRLLNTLFNIGTYVAQNKIGGEGAWRMSIKIDKDNYIWVVSKTKKGDQIIVSDEKLYLNDELIIDRDLNDFKFENKSMPKLASNELSLAILREEKIIKPLHDGFSRILRRKFFEDELAKNSNIIAINQKLLNEIGNKRDLDELYRSELALNPRLYVLAHFFPRIFNEIISSYREAFEFISDVKLIDSNDFDLPNIPAGLPILAIKEKSVDKWLRLDELSSGMQKVLLIITDLLSLPKGGIYLLDEYENSLGIGAIDFLPRLIFSRDFDFQIIVTSHHPYIIRHIPVENWYVAHRVGAKVSFAYGEELVHRYGISNQDKYVQLLNDPFYTEGIE